MRTNITLKVLTGFLLAILLMGCGGGSSSGATNTASSAATSKASTGTETSKTSSSQSVLASSSFSAQSSNAAAGFKGVFLGPVKGLRYKTATQTGETNAAGEFRYNSGEAITFSIGDIELPTLAAKALINPYIIANTENLDDAVAMNITRLLQSLDTDGNIDNGIDISATVHSMAAGAKINFSSASFATDVANLVSTSGAAQTLLIDKEIAQNNLLTSISGCTKTNSKIGQVANLIKRQHNVSGTAKVINDCSIKVSNFNFDGGGVDVVFYGAQNGDYKKGFSISDNIFGKSFNNATYLISLKVGDLDKLNSLSLWCVDFNVSFGDGLFVAL
jgi:hypothetical protein